ncbi:MAG: hypothetical protein AABX11_02155 [Nanoarchaeota archaeon]
MKNYLLNIILAGGILFSGGCISERVGGNVNNKCTENLVRINQVVKNLEGDTNGVRGIERKVIVEEYEEVSTDRYLKNMLNNDGVYVFCAALGMGEEIDSPVRGKNRLMDISGNLRNYSIRANVDAKGRPSLEITERYTGGIPICTYFDGVNVKKGIVGELDGELKAYGNWMTTRELLGNGRGSEGHYVIMLEEDVSEARDVMYKIVLREVKGLLRAELARRVSSGEIKIKRE